MEIAITSGSVMPSVRRPSTASSASGHILGGRREGRREGGGGKEGGCEGEGVG